MRLLELYLTAYGPFTDEKLDFSGKKGDFHIIFGPNEAGKSSALRALKGLLFGIAHTTSDNFIHGNADLRIGCTLLDNHEKEIRFYRRKGNKNTLLDPDGNALREDIVSEILPGIDRAYYATAFGIDHDALMRGADELIRERGDTAKSLFSAKTGSSGLIDYLHEIDREAGELYLKKGRKKVINTLLKDYRDSYSRIREKSISVREWRENYKSAEELRERIGSLSIRIKELNAEKAHREKLLRAHPKIIRRKEIINRLKECGLATIPDRNFSETRQNAQISKKNAEDERTSAQERLKILRMKLKSLSYSSEIIEQEQVIKIISDRLAIVTKAAQDAAALQINLIRHRVVAERILKNINPVLVPEDFSALQITASDTAKIRKLIREFDSLNDKSAAITENIHDLQNELTECSIQLRDLPPARDTGSLRLKVNRIKRKGDLEERIGQVQERIDSETRKTDLELAGLFNWSGPVGEFMSIKFPVPETIDRYEKKFQKITADKQVFLRRKQDYEKDIENLSGQLQTLNAGGSIPDEQELADIRSERDRGWNLIKREWLDKEDISAEKRSFSEEDLPVRFDFLLQKADETADELRRNAHLLNEISSVAQAIEKYKKSVSETDAALAALEQEQAEIWEKWSGLWKPQGVEPQTPKEMRSWLSKADIIKQKAGSITDLQIDLDLLRQSRDTGMSELRAELEKLSIRHIPETNNLNDLLQYCDNLIEEINSKNKEAEDLNKEIARREREKERKQAALSGVSDKLDSWKDEWNATVSGIGILKNSQPEEAQALLQELQELLSNAEKAEDLQNRLAGIKKDAAEFERDVEELVRRIAPQLKDLPAEQKAAQLAFLLKENIERKTKSQELRDQIDQLEEKIREKEHEITVNSEQLKALCEQAEIDSEEELPEYEKKAAEFLRLKDKLESLEDSLMDMAGDISLEHLEAKIDLADMQKTEAEIYEYEDRINELSEEKDRLLTERGKVISELEAKDGSAEAAIEAERSKMILADIGQAAEKYITLRLSSILLKREIERFREKHQGPVLRYAGEYFSQLTLGSFKAIKSDYNEKDEAVLKGERPDGTLLTIGQMSDGTVDQLYLSLRLANIKNYVQEHHPVPFIVDDIMIKFDQERAKAALTALEELSAGTQILFFTHNIGLVGLAESVCKKNAYTVHHLNSFNHGG